MKNTNISLSDYPLVSIGMPVYNSELTVAKAIESIILQDYTNIELIISDNASSDRTEKICESFVKKDNRIKYFRQKQNIDGYLNCKFVLNKSEGEYFMWAAGDDIRTLGFISTNLNVLLKHPNIVASTSPNIMGWEYNQDSRIIKFSLLGDKKSRFKIFFKHAYHSHALFFSLMRSEVIKRYSFSRSIFFAADWDVVLFLANQGEINRTNSEMMMFGKNGMSSDRKRAYKETGVNGLARILPFLFFSRKVSATIKNWPKKDSIPIYFLIIKLNIKTVLLEYRSLLYYLSVARTIIFKKIFGA